MRGRRANTSSSVRLNFPVFESSTLTTSRREEASADRTFAEIRRSDCARAGFNRGEHTRYPASLMKRSPLQEFEMRQLVPHAGGLVAPLVVLGSVADVHAA